jgi:hypothetical protein
MLKNGVYKCKVLTYEQEKIPEIYHNSDLYWKTCHADMIKLHIISNSEDSVTVVSRFGNDESTKYIEFIGYTYNKDTLSRAFIRSENGLNYYLLVCSIYKLDIPRITNSVVPITCKVSDLAHLGNTISQSDAGTSFIVNGDSCHIETIFIRSIVESLGYKVVSTDDFFWNNDKCDWEVDTNLPWDVYQEISGLNHVEMDNQNKHDS